MHISQLFAAPAHPVVVTPAGDASFAHLTVYLRENAVELTRLLQQHGGILFRGFDIDAAEQFGACATGLGATPYDYVGGNSPRTRVMQDVYTSTEYPASETISLHNEMSYLPDWPRRLLFYCAEPPAGGGQTSLASGRDILRALPQQTVQLLEERKINYVRNFQSGVRVGKSWQSTYLTENRAEVEAILRRQNSTFTWGADGSLRVSTRRDAIVRHPDTGEAVWFNQAEQWHPSSLHPEIRALFEESGLLAHQSEFGDGTPFRDEFLAEIRDVLNRQKLKFDWQRKDLLVIDNMLMMHGREAFSGSRKILVYLSGT